MRKYLPFTIAKNFKLSYVNHAVADFETCYTDESRTDVRVWAWGYADITTGEYKEGTDIDSFLDFVLDGKKVFDVGFHNLKFDGSFIIPQLFRRGFQYMNNTEFMQKWKDGENMNGLFTHNITNMGQWFSVIIVKPRPVNKSTPSFVHLWDTAKLFPMALKEIGIQYNTETTKIDEDRAFYEAIRPVGHVLTERESEYLKADCLTLVSALRAQLNKYGTIYRTRASKAFSFFKGACTDDGGTNNYKNKYEGYQQWQVPEGIPGLEDYAGATVRFLSSEVKDQIKKSGKRLVDAYEYYIPDYFTWKDIKQAYNGGISFVNPLYREQNIMQTVTVLDVNSMYPSRLRDCPIPFGRMVKKTGSPLDEKGGLWIACARVSFKLKKPYYLPCIQIKEHYGREWLSESTDYRKRGEAWSYNEDWIFFTSTDYETFCETYDFKVWKWEYYYYFPRIGNKDGKKFVDKHYADKQKADNIMQKIKKEDPNFADNPEYIKAVLDRTESKIIMNSAYGKHGTKYFLLAKDSVFLGADVPVQFVPSDKLNKEPHLEPSHYYIPYAAFVTAYARQMLVRTWNAFGGRAVYCDTDSIHFIGTEADIPEELHDVIDWDKSGALGLWKVEGEFAKARYIRPKTYIEVKSNGKTEITCAGATPQIKELMTWDNFRVGFDAWKVAEETGRDFRDHSKLTPKQYPSGVALEPVNFQINGILR